MNYIITQEQYEQLRSIDAAAFDDEEAAAAFNELIEAIGNQSASGLFNESDEEDERAT